VRPVEARRALVLGQRFGQHEPAVQEVAQRQHRCGPERPAQVDAAEPAAEHRADDEAQAERRADQAERLRALVRRGDVGDVGIGGGEAGRGDRRDDPADEQPRQRRRQRHEDEVQAQPEARQQDHRAPAVAVGQRALDRRGHELDRREHGAEDPDPVRGADDVAADHLFDQVRQHRDDQAEREDVDQDGDEDEGQRGLARAVGDWITHEDSLTPKWPAV
jgi:hypothetical protein